MAFPSTFLCFAKDTPLAKHGFYTRMRKRTEVFAYDFRGILTGKQRRLPSAALRQPLYAQISIYRAQQTVFLLIVCPIYHGSAPGHFAEPRQIIPVKRILFTGISQPDTVHK
ncbi:MAG: hypothetical protein U5K31_08355 [Balneolaceae bacterium]|nr:hypothetical protein [Balneolaceae bacterium]